VKPFEKMKHTRTGEIEITNRASQTRFGFWLHGEKSHVVVRFWREFEANFAIFLPVLIAPLSAYVTKLHFFRRLSVIFIVPEDSIDCHLLHFRGRLQLSKFCCVDNPITLHLPVM
jgi:hypothetical protein